MIRSIIKSFLVALAVCSTTLYGYYVHAKKSSLLQPEAQTAEDASFDSEKLSYIRSQFALLQNYKPPATTIVEKRPAPLLSPFSPAPALAATSSEPHAAPATSSPAIVATSSPQIESHREERRVKIRLHPFFIEKKVE